MKHPSYALGMLYEALLLDTLRGDHEYSAKSFQNILDAQTGHSTPKPAAKYVPDIKKKMLKVVAILLKRKDLAAQGSALNALRSRLENTVEPTEIADILEQINDTAFPIYPNDSFGLPSDQL